MTLIMAAFALFWPVYGQWILLAFSLLTVAIHGGQELVGWWGKRVWWLFLIAQTTFVTLAVVGFGWDQPWALWLLAAGKMADAIGFHVLFHPEWPGRDTLLLPFADATIVALWMGGGK